MGEPTPLERRIELRTEFYHEATAFSKSDGEMRVIIGMEIDKLLTEYNDLVELVTVEPRNDPTPT